MATLCRDQTTKGRESIGQPIRWVRMAAATRILRPEAKISFLTPLKKPPYHPAGRVGDRPHRDRKMKDCKHCERRLP